MRGTVLPQRMHRFCNFYQSIDHILCQNLQCILPLRNFHLGIHCSVYTCYPQRQSIASHRSGHPNKLYNGYTRYQKYRQKNTETTQTVRLSTLYNFYTQYQRCHHIFWRHARLNYIFLQELHSESDDLEHNLLIYWPLSQERHFRHVESALVVHGVNSYSSAAQLVQ